MAQARTINEKEAKRLFAFIGSQRNAIRNKAMLALSYYCGLRAKEIASLKIGDVMKANGTNATEVESFTLTHTQNSTLRHLSNQCL